MKGGTVVEPVELMMAVSTKGKMIIPVVAVMQLCVAWDAISTQPSAVTVGAWVVIAIGCSHDKCQRNTYHETD